MYRILFPDWRVHLSLDEETYNSPYKELFDYYLSIGEIDVTVFPRKPLCEMMLFRLAPIFMQDENYVQRYDRVICRDIDSLPTYRERQAVEYWIKTGRVVHAMTDSVSHNIPLMGGMCGFETNPTRKLLGVASFERMLMLDKSIDLNIKGSDQTFLQKVILPKVAQSMTEHYVLGLPQSFRGECYNYIQDDVVSDISNDLKETNILVNHIGQAGFIMEPVLKFLETHELDSEKFQKIERKFPEVFYWHLTREIIANE